MSPFTIIDFAQVSMARKSNQFVLTLLFRLLAQQCEFHLYKIQIFLFNYILSLSTSRRILFKLFQKNGRLIELIFFRQ